MASKDYPIPDALALLNNNFKASPTAQSGVAGNLQWPEGGNYDYIQIDIVDFVKVTQLTINTAENIIKGSATPVEGESGVATDISQDTSFISNIQSQFKINAAPHGTVILPIPNNVNYSDTPNYTTNNGIIGKMLPKVASQIMSGDGSGEIAKTVQAAAGAGATGAAMSMLDSVAGVGGGSANQVTQNAFGRIQNPYTEQVFNGVNMRTFSFDWKLVPRNSTETIRIKAIIKKLRAMALPDYAGTLGNNDKESGSLSDRWLTIPKIFRISWHQGENGSEIDSLPKLKPCILTGVTVNYTPDAVWATYRGADPVAYTMQLSFTETEIITQTEVINQGF
jgi:hypothetical protein